ncbi:MAG: homocysteine S-methyltransferase family protein [Bifidobacteriaceae bacterium]|nr:homocysteine S-methyltransferase family protein [Bifidobacteriaceae bacterium]
MGSLRGVLGRRVVVADGAMGTQLMAAGLTPADYAGFDGCHEYLNLSRPDVVASVHAAYLDVGVDAVETNSFGANPSNLGEYGLAGRIEQLAHASARIAREVASSYTRRRWVFGSIGPGSWLPSLGHVAFADLRDAFEVQAFALLEGGADLLLIETAQDPLSAKAAVIAARRARARAGVDAPIIVQITVETTGTMLLGTETMAALTSLMALGIDGMGLNCATGPDSMREHLTQLAAHLPITSVMPNAGLPELTLEGAVYGLTPAGLADALDEFTGELGTAIVGGCCGTTPRHMREVVRRVGGRDLDRPAMDPHPAAGRVASLFTAVALRQDVSYLAIGERANAQGSKAFREALHADDMDRCVDLACGQARAGAHVVDVCVDAVGRDGSADMAGLTARLATASTLPIMVDSTDPAVVRAALEHLGGKAIVNSVTLEDGGARLREVVGLVREHGAAVVALTIDEEGQARTAERKIAIAERLIDAVVAGGVDERDVIVDPLTFPVAAGDETRRDGLATLAAIRAIRAAHPNAHLMLGVSNISFGLAPRARVVLNSVFLAEAVAAGLDAAIVNPARIEPLDRMDPALRAAAVDLIYDRRSPDALAVLLGAATDAPVPPDDAGPHLTGSARLAARIATGRTGGMDADLAEALAERGALGVLDEVLLPAMAEVGEAFGAGRMQLPFVLQAAEAMKAAVAWLEPHMPRRGAGKGTVVLATVRGDVHDIGKNLVDIILTNNGYRVINLGIKQSISAMVDAADTHGAHAIGMSGLLVKSVEVMRENLAEMNARGRLLPVILGGAALTRAYVDDELRGLYHGEVRYAKDAFEALAILGEWKGEAGGDGVDGDPGTSRRDDGAHGNAGCGAGRADVGVVGAALVDGDVVARRGGAEPHQAGGRPTGGVPREDGGIPRVPIPAAPFWGSRLAEGVALSDYLPHLDERALLRARWGLRAAPGDPRTAEEIVEAEGLPRMRVLLERVRGRGLARARVAYGFFMTRAEGDSLVIEGPDGGHTIPFPRQERPPHLAIPDYVADEGDVIGLQVVTVGADIAEAASREYAAGHYRDYLELHTLGSALAEALADYWHERMRRMLGITGGRRYSFGYPSCPDLSGRRVILDLTGARRIGVDLTETDLLVPEQSTDAMIIHHPAATYFSVRPAGRDTRNPRDAPRAR